METIEEQRARHAPLYDGEGCAPRCQSYGYRDWTYAQEERLRVLQSSGIVTGVGAIIGYDSTDNAFKPHRGIRSNWEAEICALARNSSECPDFPFLRWHSLNAFYYPFTATGTLKLRADFKFIQPMLGGSVYGLPLTERFFLGGENTVRGYKPAQLGPEFKGTNGENKPLGGATSTLVSIEYLQNVIGPLDAFAFVDAGAISTESYTLGQMRATFGGGIRVDIGRGLPLLVGYGWPIGESDKSKIQGIFFSMAGEF